MSKRNTVMGIHAPPPKPKVLGALWLATMAALPVALVVAIIEVARAVLP